MGWVGAGAAALAGVETGPLDVVIVAGAKAVSTAMGTYAGQKAGQLVGSIVCSSSTGSGGNGGSPVLSRDGTGKVHGNPPDHVPENWTREDLEEAAHELQQSIKVREQEQIRLGEEGAHRARIEQERQLLRQIEKKLGGS